MAIQARQVAAPSRQMGMMSLNNMERSINQLIKRIVELEEEMTSLYAQVDDVTNSMNNSKREISIDIMSKPALTIAEASAPIIPSAPITVLFGVKKSANRAYICRISKF